MTNNTKFAITFDTDWAPDWMMNEIASILISNEVKSTWFVTHDSPFLTVLREKPSLFEIGIHPNCFPGSTQGSNEDEILANLKKSAPEAISMRTSLNFKNTIIRAEIAEKSIPTIKKYNSALS